MSLKDSPSFARVTRSSVSESPSSEPSIPTGSAIIKFFGKRSFNAISINSDTKDETVGTPPSPVSPEIFKRPKLSGVGDFPEKKPSFLSKVVTLIVTNAYGESEKYQVHKDFLTYHSPYFERAFNGFYMESITGDWKHQTESLVAFRLFIHWCYIGVIGEENEDIDAFTLIHLWLLADEFLVLNLQDKVIDTLRGLDYLPSAYFQLVYRETVDGSALRKVFVEKCVSELKHIHHPAEFPIEMLADIFNVMKERKTFKKGNGGGKKKKSK